MRGPDRRHSRGACRLPIPTLHLSEATAPFEHPANPGCGCTRNGAGAAIAKVTNSTQWSNHVAKRPLLRHMTKYKTAVEKICTCHATTQHADIRGAYATVRCPISRRVGQTHGNCIHNTKHLMAGTYIHRIHPFRYVSGCNPPFRPRRRGIVSARCMLARARV